ncbi:MAG: DNA polymerase IV [Propionibacteriaceae bacterium]|nr:DNA polymerase IV [Propionibacteriaceae bacterium]
MPVIAHVDMDAFYASVEMVRRPALRHVPMFVGGSERGVVLSANYLARTFGIEGGMPSARARRLCPQVVAVRPDFERYQEVSESILAVFETFSDTIEAASIDEAFIDLTGSLLRLGSPENIGEQLRERVADEQRIGCSVGIGPNKFIAKLASKAAKPDGLRVVRTKNVVDFLHPLPVEAIWGVGKATAARLRRLGLTTVGELSRVEPAVLRRVLGEQQGRLLADLAWGRDRRSMLARAPREHSVGCQTTFGRDTDAPSVVETEILRMAERVASRARAQRMVGRGVTLTVRFADFSAVNRTGTLYAPTDLTGEIYTEALRLFRRLRLQRARVRLVGVRLEKLTRKSETYEQPTLDEPEHGWAEAEAAVDAAVLRFGPKALRRAALTVPRG